MQCVILAGGLGSRLGSLTRSCPKPMLPVSGVPFIELLISNVARYGFTNFILLAGYKAEVISKNFKKNQFQTKSGLVDIKVLRETIPLGTAGALTIAKNYLDDNFLLMNGDSFFSFNILNLIQRKNNTQSLGSIALRYVEDARRYNVISVNKNGLIDQIHSKNADVDKGGVINGGVYWLKKTIVDFIDEESFVSLEDDIFPLLIEKKLVVAELFDGDFIDIGIPSDYAHAQNIDLLKKPAVFFDRDGVLNFDSGHTYKEEELEWISGAKEAVKLLNDNGYYVFVVTNQAGVAKGIYSEDHIRTFHNKMQSELFEAGAHIDEFIYCPHHEEAVVEGYKLSCPNRKPSPGMINDLLLRWDVETNNSFMIGDKETDIEAAKCAGILGYKYESGSVCQLVENILALR